MLAIFRLRHLILVLSLLLCHQLFAQQHSKKIVLHLNKSTFISGESIQFSSYLLHIKSYELYTESEYINIQLLDVQGNIIDKRLTLSKNGLGSGGFILDNKMKSGQYYLQAYTDDMNSLKKDYSSVYPISVINIDSGLLPEFSDSSNINIDFFPEGGNLVEDIFNSCVIQIKDAFNKPIKPDSIILSNNKDLQRQVIEINEMGLGKFSIVPDKKNNFLITAFHHGKSISIPLISANETGFVLMASTNHKKKEIAISIRTNAVTNKLMKSKPITLLVDNANNSELLKIPIVLTDLKKDFLIPYKELENGINTVSILEGNDSILASRSFFILKDEQTSKPQITSIKRENDSLTIRIKTTLANEANYNASISLSVLPKKSVSQADHFPINSNNTKNGILSLQHNQHDQNSKQINDQLYLTDLSLLTNQADFPTYEKENSSNHQNLSSINGYVNLFKTENDSLTIMLYSLGNELFETTPLLADKKFQFKNIPLINNSSISLTVLDRNGKTIYANFFFTVTPFQVKYNYNYSASKEQINTVKLDSIKNPVLSTPKEISLDEVVVVENKLKHAKFFGEFHGRKVDSTMLNFITLGSYMKQFGLMNRYVPTTTSSSSDIRREGSEQLYKLSYDLNNRPIYAYPSLIFNGVFTEYVMDYAETSMEFIDEIYYLKRKKGDPGHFVVFTNEKYLKRPLAESDKNSKEFTIARGYDGPTKFVRPFYTSFDNISYHKWGVIGWFPHLTPDKNSIITFKVPDDGQKELNLQLVGTAQNGTLFNQNLLCTVPD